MLALSYKIFSITYQKKNKVRNHIYNQATITKADMGFGDFPPILRKDAADSEWTPYKAFLITFMSVMNVFMFLGNILSLATICSNAKLRQQVSYWFVMNLAVIDLLISVTVVPLNIVWEYYGTWPFNHVTCEFFTFADIAFSTISAYSIVLVSIDKYIYINFSIQYFEKMTRKIAVILIVTVWIFVFIFGTISLLTEVGTNESFQDHFLTITNANNTCIFVMTDAFVIPSAIISFFLPFGILCFTSSRIVCIASKHIRKIHTISNNLISDTDSDLLKAARTKLRGNTLTSVTNDSSREIRVNKANTAVYAEHKENKTVQISEQRNDSQLQTMTGKGTEINGNITNNSSKPEPSSTTTSSQYDTIQPHLILSTNNGMYSYDNRGRDTDLDNDESLDIGSSKINNNSINLKNVIKPPSSDRSNSSDSVQTLSKVKMEDTTSAKNPTTSAEQESTQNSTNTKTVRSKSNRHIKHSESLRSLTLKKSESLKSFSIRKRKSPYCKLFGTVTIVIACFILMFAPYNIAIMVDVWCRCIQPWVYEDILAVLYYMHSLVNPYIYMATDRKYKAALKQLMRKVGENVPCCKKCDK